MFAPLWGGLSDRVGPATSDARHHRRHQTYRCSLWALPHLCSGSSSPACVQVSSAPTSASLRPTSADLTRAVSANALRWMGLIGAALRHRLRPRGQPSAGCWRPSAITCRCWRQPALAAVNFFYGTATLREPAVHHGDRRPPRCPDRSGARDRAQAVRGFVRLHLRVSASWRRSSPSSMIDRFDYAAREVAYILVMMAR